MGDGPNGLFALTISMFDALASGSVVADFVQPIVSFVAISLLAAGLWAGMALFFGSADGTEKNEQDFVMISSLGFCLLVFGALMFVAVSGGNAKVGALSALASFATILSGVAHKVTVAQSAGSEFDAPNKLDANVSKTYAAAMASQSALLANAGARNSRFVPKRPYQP
ncbi:MAG: hypothetical protein U5K75_00685 [Ahrensia sp.]|nr:hypothetical protein [Ahrensia sp.]